ncbi:uncharacterized protein LOC110847054 [Folsomia candida]|uniref:uncharacterized protein LOC110847054 n=1 Tax=Folsomia candida TaxID=158441 RepID=UPI0016053A90|nr:uncharacterized protein LOC110847054 [Folsomia candida]
MTFPTLALSPSRLLIVLAFGNLFSISDAKNSTIRCERRDRCLCPTDPVTARYSDPEDPSCDRYYLCHMGNAFLKYCDVRNAFHPEKKECLPRISVPEALCPAAVNCDKNGFQADPKDCTMYYMCFYRQAYHYGCEVDHYYDKDKEECLLDKVKSSSCRKARSEVQPETSNPPAKHPKRMLTEFVEPLPQDLGQDQDQDPGEDSEYEYSDETGEYDEGKAPESKTIYYSLLENELNL